MHGANSDDQLAARHPFDEGRFQPNALSGRAFVETIADLPPRARENA